MGKKLKFMLLTLLGFSAACSTVRNGAGSDSGGKTQSEPVEEAPEVLPMDSIRTIRLLYGVRRPEPRPETEARTEERNGTVEGSVFEPANGSAQVAAGRHDGAQEAAAAEESR